MKKTPTEVKEKRSPGILSVIADIFLAIILVACYLLPLLSVYLNGVNEVTELPALSKYFDSDFSLILPFILIAFFGILLLVANVHKIRRAFFTSGVSLILAIITSLVTGFLSTRIFQALPEEWGKILIISVEPFRSLAFMYALPLLLLCIFSFSIYACIKICKGGAKK